MTARRYVRGGTRLDAITAPPGRIIVHNHVRPEGFPDVVQGQDGFRVWFDLPTPTDYPVVVCRCRATPLLGRHFRVAR